MEASVPEWLYPQFDNQITIPIFAHHTVDEATAVALILPALGVKARYYRHLAAGLAANNIAAYVLEQRGHGESPYRAKRGAKFGYNALLDVDINIAIESVRKRHPELPFYLGGHSLGGHMSSIIAGERPDEIDGVFHLACGFPYVRFFPGKQGAQVRFLAHLIPVLAALLGYYPGEKLGFGGREYRQLMMDWRRWALKGEYDFDGRVGLEAKMAAYRGRALSINFDKDYFVSEQALAFSRSRLKSARMTQVTLGEAEQGKFLGHFDWAKEPSGAVQALAQWITEG